MNLNEVQLCCWLLVPILFALFRRKINRGFAIKLSIGGAALFAIYCLLLYFNYSFVGDDADRLAKTFAYLVFTFFMIVGLQRTDWTGGIVRTAGVVVALCWVVLAFMRDVAFQERVLEKKLVLSPYEVRVYNHNSDMSYAQWLEVYKRYGWLERQLPQEISLTAQTDFDLIDATFSLRGDTIYASQDAEGKMQTAVFSLK